MDVLLLIPLGVGALSLLVVAIIYYSITKEDTGTPKMREIAGYIEEGANAFLKREFKTIAYFSVPIAVTLLVALWPRHEIAVGFMLGSLFSGIATYIGMKAAVKTNVRVTNAARSSVRRALTLAFGGGGITGLLIVSLNLIGVTMLYVIFGGGPHNPEVVSELVGFGFGASLTALFAQVGGGIFTKAADVGADLVGKVEIGIPEDDPRNPAVIADLVGDNVGDCAGRGADLFESGSDNLVCMMILGLTFLPVYGWKAVVFPLLIRSTGNLATIAGIAAIRFTGGMKPINRINFAYLTAGVLSLIVFYCVSVYFMRDIRLFYCLTLGLVTALVVAIVTQYYTSESWQPVKDIALASKSSPAVNIMIGLAYGLESAVPSMTIVALSIAAAYLIFGGDILGIFGVAAAAMGLTEMKGIIMASDTYGPIVDNAAGIAEMSHLEREVEEAMDKLDAVGNITKAITKGFAMAAGILTTVVILFAYVSEAARYAGIELNSINDIVVNVVNPLSIAGFLTGATIPFIFSAMIIRAVSKAAHEMVEEVRRQFREIPGILEGEAKPNYAQCVDISTKHALEKMILPTLVGLVTPAIVGFLGGPWILAAFMVAASIVGALLATFMFNAGGAWDNAKKLIESGFLGGKGTPEHAAAVIGDTVGDPLKDSAGPSLHILIKLVSIVSITLLPLFIQYALLMR
ncbi:MAG: sodium-translocating pyrophosphatase [archaeon GB-1867-005]|nr:sodium-translocating pyrophosphatase [Candidatus Culexmicrobium cathedralense]